ATTLGVMAGLLGVLFIGMTFLAVNFGITHIDLPEKQTVISQVAGRVYGSGSIPFFLFQGFTALLLVLAANTSFNAFPRLLAILAIDGNMPRQFSFRGDRLAFSYGIVVLATIAKAPQSLIVIVLIPLLVGLMNFVHREYAAQEAELAVRPDFVVPAAHREQRVVIPVNSINRAVIQAVIFGRTLATDVRAVF